MAAVVHADIVEAPSDPPGPGALTAEQVAEFGAEMDRIRDEVLSSLGEADAAYIRRVIDAQRRLDLAGRITLLFGILPPAWVAGTTMLSIAKILENMEIGHNVMHGQWDWMRDPEIHSTTWEWDNACPSKQWKHSHNQVHHVWTNVVGRDRDVGYGLLRISEDQPWHPAYLAQPVYAAVLACLFQWGVAMHDVDVDGLMNGRRDVQGARVRFAEVRGKARRQLVKDYVAFPALAGPMFLPVLLGNATANLARNVWSASVIFCGHFPGAVPTFTPADVVAEDRAGWYVRQVIGSANISGGRLLHLMTGNLSHQIEHHLFPDLPSNRYPQIAPTVRETCERFGLPYVTGSFPRQVASVAKRIFRMALP
ncbi:MAG: acyl-CoA desaturase [Actinobacteria bacterium]|nr:acyl-CoA desaturase [Actinomycetota bacterium]